jgi:hypothetical protein
MDLFKLHNYCAACLWLAGYLATGQCLATRDRDPMPAVRLLFA